MTTYEFIRDYKSSTRYRLSFNKLAQATFGIDFETWSVQEVMGAKSYYHAEEAWVVTNCYFTKAAIERKNFE
jgi:hypothetical protein